MPTRPTKDDVDNCRRCALWQRATQGVPGEGPANARLMLVGEQPGDAEDRAGKPFVGPAGELLRRALAEAGIDPAEIYITNAVKHFSWEPRGIRRIHKKPLQREIAACHDWLDAEIRAIRPACIVALGATALLALTGKPIPVGTARESELEDPSGATLIATYHPSALLRAIEPSQREALYRTLVADLRRALEATGAAAVARDRR
jgi:uracil-DNA glycosylase family protein